MEISVNLQRAIDADPLVKGLYSFDEVVSLLMKRRNCRFYVCCTHEMIANDQTGVPNDSVRILSAYSSVHVTKRAALSFVRDMYKSRRETHKIECMVSNSAIFIGRTP